MPPSDSLIPVDRRSGSPCRRPTLRRVLVLHTESRRHPRPRARRRVVTGSPSHRDLSERNEGLPGSWIILFVRAPVVHPAGCPAALPHTDDDAVVFRDSELLDIQDSPLFEAALPAAHTLACLRIAMTVTRAGARLTSTLPGSALGGWDLHPLDNELIFKEFAQPPFPSDQPFLVAPEYMAHHSFM